jgi:hypothetical protein
MTNAQLGNECLTRGLPNYGNKQQLTDRLIKHDAAQASAPQENPVTDDDDFPNIGEDTSETLAPPSIPVPIHPDPELDRLKAEMRAELAAMRNERAAANGEKVEPGQRADDTAIRQVIDSEAKRVFTAEYPLPKAAGLGEEIHAAFCAQVVDDARAAGMRTRGGGRRLGSRNNEAGQHVEVYGVYARKQ